MLRSRQAGTAALSKVIIVAVVAAAIVGVVTIKHRPAGEVSASAEAAKSAGVSESPATDPKKSNEGSPVAQKPDAPAAKPASGAAPEKGDEKKLPRLVDLGAGKCVPCKAMKPILEGLREDYRGKFEVVFIDVWENRDAGSQYGIRVIPTQIFYDETGKERFRHEGFFSREDILKTWKDLGYSFD